MKRLVLLLLASSLTAFAKLSVVTSTTDLAWLTSEIAGDHAAVVSLLRGTENPHYVDTVPNFIRLVADADVVCSVGLELEIGWMPKVLAKSGNARVQPGGAGFCETGRRVSVLEKPTGAIDRSMGDVHPAGNPHFWLSPRHFSEAIPEIVGVLSGADAAHSADYKQAGERLTKQLLALEKQGQGKLRAAIAALGPTPVVEYHKEFSYLLSAYGVRSFGSIEEKPGVPPSAGRLLEVARAARAAGVKVVLAADTSPRKTLEKFTELSNIPVLILPTSIRKDTDYVDSHTKSVDLLLQSLAGVKG